MESSPVDEGYEEGHGGEAGLEAPGDGVECGEGVWTDSLGVEFPPDNNPGVDDVVEGQEADTWLTLSRAVWHQHLTLVCHVDEPLDAEGVDGGHKVCDDPCGHEEGEASPVDDIASAGVVVLSLPLAGVKQIYVGMNKTKLCLE